MRVITRLDPRRRSIRVRLSLFSLVTVAIALAASSAALVMVQRALLTDRIDDAISTRARDIAAQLQPGQSQAILNERGEDAFIQLLDRSGDVIASSDNISGKPPVTTAVVGTRELRLLEIAGVVLNERDRYRVAAYGVDSGDQQITVLVGGTLEPVTESTEALISALAVGIPALTLLVGVAAWLLAGRALKPVDTMRSEVDQIGGEIAGRRIDEPRSEDEIARLARTLNSMLERVDLVQESQKRFVADASHELRTPLTAFKSGLEANIATSPGEDVTRMLRASLSDVTRMELLIEDLLAEAAGNETEQGKPALLDLDDLVLEEITSSRFSSGMEIDSSGVSGAQVHGRAEQLRRAVRNVLNNAVRHAESKVSVTLQETGHTVRLLIEDDGAGIPEAERERIFERFVRLDSARSRDRGGAGLGLTITNRIVEAHSGRIYVDSAFASGARFVIELPASATQSS